MTLLLIVIRPVSYMTMVKTCAGTPCMVTGCWERVSAMPQVNMVRK